MTVHLFGKNNSSCCSNYALKQCAKRGILSQLCTIFDPLGILNPCTLELKLIVQELWLRKIEWDSIIPKDLLDRFNKFQNRFIYLENIEINRYYGFDSSAETTELHIFAK